MIGKESCLNKNLNESIKKTIDIIRIFAIISIIAAHVNKFSTDGSLLGFLVTRFWCAYGQVGVVCFFIIGGFLYTRYPMDAKTFWKKKVKMLIIPWLFCSLITYMVRAYIVGEVSISEYLKHILGIGTWYYYVTVYLLFLLVFKYIQKSNSALYICVIINVVALLLSTLNIDLINIEWMTQYLNCFHWVGFFALGILIRRNNLGERIVTSTRLFLTSCTISIISFICMCYLDLFGYFNLLSLIWEISMACVVTYCANLLSYERVGKRIIHISGYTYCIYLLHMQIVQIFCKLLPSNIIFWTINPIVSTILMIFIIEICKKIVMTFPFGNVICQIVGLRF